MIEVLDCLKVRFGTYMSVDDAEAWWDIWKLKMGEMSLNGKNL